MALFYKNPCAGAGAPGVCATVKSPGKQRVESIQRSVRREGTCKICVKGDASSVLQKCYLLGHATLDAGSRKFANRSSRGQDWSYNHLETYNDFINL